MLTEQDLDTWIDTVMDRNGTNDGSLFEYSCPETEQHCIVGQYWSDSGVALPDPENSAENGCSVQEWIDTIAGRGGGPAHSDELTRRLGLMQASADMSNPITTWGEITDALREHQWSIAVSIGGSSALVFDNEAEVTP